MLAFFQCVAETIAEKGVRGLIEMVPGGPYACSVAEGAWKKYRERRNAAEQRAELQSLAQASFEEARQAAVQAAREAVGKAGSQPDKASDVALELYLAQIPGTVRQSLKRPDDPTGKTVPAAFALNSPEDLLKLLPAKPPQFRPGDPLPGKPGWVLEQPLGTGGFGEVWLARHPKMASLNGAVKFCHGQQARELRHEGAMVDRVMAAGRHPNIVPLLDAGLEGDSPWLMYEYVPGGDLADLVRSWQKLDPAERVGRAAGALRTLAKAVGHFHRLDPPIVHRDLKPANILLAPSPGGGAKVMRITDFGIGAAAARAALAEETAGSSTRGGRLLSSMRGSHTPLYASPQQREGADPDPRDDVHALGVIGYQLITGNLAQGGGSDVADDLKEAGAPDGLVTLIARCVAQKPDRRPKDAAELAQALEPFASPATPSRAAPPPVPPTVPPTPPSAPVLPGANADRETIIRHVFQLTQMGSRLIPLGKKIGGIVLLVMFGAMLLSASMQPTYRSVTAYSPPDPSRTLYIIGGIGFLGGTALLWVPYIRNRRQRSTAVAGILSVVEAHRGDYPELGTLPADPDDLERVKQIGLQTARLLEKACTGPRVSAQLVSAANPSAWSDTSYQVYLDERLIGSASHKGGMQLTTQTLPGKHLVRLALGADAGITYIIEVPSEAKCVVRFAAFCWATNSPPQVTVA